MYSQKQQSTVTIQREGKYQKPPDTLLEVESFLPQTPKFKQVNEHNNIPCWWKNTWSITVVLPPTLTKWNPVLWRDMLEKLGMEWGWGYPTPHTLNLNSYVYKHSMFVLTHLAKSRSSWTTASLPRADPCRAAWLMRLARSAPEKPGVPRATISRSTPEQ